MRGLALLTCLTGLCCLLPLRADAQGPVKAARDSLSVRAQGRPAVEPACCSIVRIDSSRRMVTARETATGFTFRFDPRSRRVMNGLKVGQPVWADFTKKTVKLSATDSLPCCAMIAYTAP